MTETNAVIKKLQFKDQGQPVLILNAPHAYDEVIRSFNGEVHKVAENEAYDFAQVFERPTKSFETKPSMPQARWMKTDCCGFAIPRNRQSITKDRTAAVKA